MAGVGLLRLPPKRRPGPIPMHCSRRPRAPRGKAVRAKRSTCTSRPTAPATVARRACWAIFTGRGSGDVGRDYGEQLQWYEKAKAAGVDVPTPGKRKY